MPYGSHVNLICGRKRIADLDAEVTESASILVAEQQLDGFQIASGARSGYQTSPSGLVSPPQLPESTM
jgi:hypothetical protein